MTNVRSRGERVRRFIIENVSRHPSDIAKVTAEKFNISRQAANKHIQNLVDEKALVSEGISRARIYKLRPLATTVRCFARVPGLSEDVVWREDVAPFFAELPTNVVAIWQHGFTEMFNNAIDHSGGKSITLRIQKTAASTEMEISDDGVGIFKKIQQALALADERHAVLELAKGKFTTDPAHHSGEGIFFTSRMFDGFHILSGGVFFSHEFGEAEDWILEPERSGAGTIVSMSLSNHTARTTKKVFDQFASEEEDYGFTKTVVPVRLAQYGDDKLVSRSQAKRLLARVDRFKTVVLDFKWVDSIGQGFADEVFGVFAMSHPEVNLVPMNANSAVKRMIAWARSGRGIQPPR